MKITAFFPSPPEGENFTDILARELANEEGEFFIVHVNYQRPGYHDQQSDCKGLDVALTLNPEEAPIILCSFLPESYLVSKDEFNYKFYALMAKKRIGFLDLSKGFDPDSWLKKYHELLGDKKEDDLLAIEINKIKTFEEGMGHIQHRVQSYFRDDSVFAKTQISQAVEEARKIGATGSDEEVALQIRNFERKPQKSIFAGRFFHGVFCDIEDTLLINGEVNEMMLKTLRDLSIEKPITLWTGGDVEDLKKILIKKNITWKLVSKSDFTGAEVETAYDDHSYERFHSEYGIKVRQFNQVTHNHDVELGLKLEFLHSLLLASGVPDVLINSEFSSILDMLIESKEIREYVKEMGDEKDENQYNQILIIIRDFLMN